jgi:hypothetical protein
VQKCVGVGVRVGVGVEVEGKGRRGMRCQGDQMLSKCTTATT